MELEHEFTIPVPVKEAWPILLDLERVAPCVPGATLDSIDGEEFTGRLRVKVGAMTITYRGGARIVSADENTHTATIEGSAKEARGSGTAAAAIQAHLEDEGEATRVTVHTKLNVTGRPAQFGRNLLSEVGAKLVSRFADNLAAELTGPPPKQETETEPEPPAEVVAEPAAPAATTAQDDVLRAVPQDRDDVINLLELAGPSILKRLVPAVVAAIAGLLAVRYLYRRIRRG